jgi:hypothetical protein
VHLFDVSFFVWIDFVSRFKVIFRVDAFHVVYVADMAIARDAFIIGAQIGLDAPTFAA